MQRLQKMLLLPALLLFAGPALADDPAETAGVVEEIEGEALLDLNAFADDSTLITDEELNSHRAKEDIAIDSIVLNDQDQDGDVTDNVAIGNTNGDNLINGEAFSNSSGFLSTVQNTGNNVLIQNSTIINVTVETSP